MSGVVDGFLVGLALLAGFGYASYSLGPKSWRARLLGAIAAVSGSLPGGGPHRIVRRIAAAAAKVQQGTCGGCGTCGSNEAAPRSGTPQQDAAGGGEIRVPLSRIGKRR